MSGWNIDTYEVTEIQPDGVQITGFSFVAEERNSQGNIQFESVTTGDGEVDDDTSDEVALVNYYMRGASWTPEVVKLLNGKPHTAGAQGYNGYTFTLAEPAGQNTIHVPGQPDIHSETAVSNENGRAVFGKIDYHLEPNESSRTYSYTITESRPAAAQDAPYIANDILYDTKKVYVVVTVTKTGEGTNRIVEAHAQYYSDAEHTQSLSAVTFDNTELGSLIVEKTVTGNYTVSEDDEFPFTVMKGDQYVTASESGNTYTYTGLSNMDPEYTVKADQTLTFINLPVGEYEVTEGSVSKIGYEITTSYTITQNGETLTGGATVAKGKTTAVKIENRYRDAELIIKKTINGAPTEDALALITFEIEDVTAGIGDDEKTPIIRHIKLSTTEASTGRTFTSAHDGINPGHTYKVTETVTAPDGYVLRSTSYEVKAGTEAADNETTTTTGSLTLTDHDTSTGEIDFTNTYELTNLTINKAMNVGTSTENFAFTVKATKGEEKFTGTAYLDEAKRQQIIFNNGNSQELTIKAGEPVTIYGIPEGYTYEVTEADKLGFLLVSVSVDGETAQNPATGTISATGSTAAFVNKEVVDVNGTKTWHVDADPLPNYSDITLELWRSTAAEPDDTDWTEVKEATPTWSGKSYTFANLDKYDAVSGEEYKYRVTEKSFMIGEVKYTIIDASTGIATPDDDTSPIMKLTQSGNDFVNEELTEIQINKTWGGGAWPEGILVGMTLKADDNVVKGPLNYTRVYDGNTINVPIGANEDAVVWLRSQDATDGVTWINLPKYNDSGAEINYTVTETAMRYVYNRDAIDILNWQTAFTTDPITYVGSPENGVVTIKNTPKTTSIEVTKDWTQNHIARTDRTEINYALYKNTSETALSGYTVSVPDGWGTAEADKVQYITGQSAWQTVTISDLPLWEVQVDTSGDTPAVSYVGLTYHVVETDAPLINGADPLANTTVTYGVTPNEQGAAEGAEMQTASEAATDSGKITIHNRDYLVDLEIYKMDSESMGSGQTPKYLAGAAFSFVKVDEMDPTKPSLQQYDVTYTGNGTVTGIDGKAMITGIPAGYYKLTETTVPPGYILTDNREIYFKIKDGHITFVEWKQVDGTWKWVDKGSDSKLKIATQGDSTTNDEVHGTVQIGNKPGVALPSTGGSGTTLYYIAGSALLLLALLGLILRKKERSGMN